MKNKIILATVICCMFVSGYLFSGLRMNNNKNINAYASEQIGSDTRTIYREELISEMKKETNSLSLENQYLRAELSQLKKQLKSENKAVEPKFHGYTIYYTLDKRYSSVFRENKWENGNFTVDGHTYMRGIGFDRKENGDRNHYVAKLYNYNGEYSRLTGLIGIDDLAKDLDDAQITFAVYNNDVITKCYNEFYGDTLYKTQFKKSDGLQKIDVNLKGANSIIIEFSVNQKSNLNNFLLLEPQLK
ncbi:NPCBM/NEW2 domain-containing protein [Alkaliphilus oremlandii]|uniref:Glycosyl hydrolase family 98 putative carbohydrate-binding module domain-containing protein n=1 Tax=Alkaliphilus oremlandii (strain OhILAs) TaxID=350688 RepID=A8MKX2_ALKOO|nr:NPCBM/NEW2 domain-containing protein [Alkaliphilus oremlandii]ABW17789.1 hypothetical protein Clos_0226 [Alkaliphilus oremlandii OhILAs]